MTSDPCPCGGREFSSTYTNVPMRYVSVCKSCGSQVECNQKPGMTDKPKSVPAVYQPPYYNDDFGIGF